MKKLLVLCATLMFTASLVVKAEPIIREGTLQIVGGSSNVTETVNLFSTGVGRAPANEVMKVAFYNPTTLSTTKVSFVSLDLAGNAVTSIASQDYTAGVQSYVNNAPFYTFVTGISNTTTNYAFVPYTCRQLQIQLYQSKTNSASVTNTYYYSIMTR